MKNRRTLIALIILITIGFEIIYSAQSRYEQSKELASLAEANLLRAELKSALDNYQKAQDKFPIYSKQIAQTKEQIQKNPLAVFLKDESTDSQIRSLVQELSKTTGVRTVELINKEKAREEFLRKKTEGQLLLEETPAEVFPQSLSVYLNAPYSTEEIMKVASSSSIVERIVSSYK